MSDIKPFIEELSAQFAEFKSQYDTRAAAIEKTLDDIVVRNACAEMKGPVNDSAPQVGVRAMRTYPEFKAHYAAKAESQEPVSVSDFLRGVAGMSTAPAVRAALQVGTDTAGGYAVPSVVMPTIMSALTANSSLLQAGAGIVPLEVGAKTATIAAVDTVPTASWRLEAGNVIESDPAFRGALLAPQSLAFYFKVSRELIADAAGIESALQLAIAQSFAKAIDYAGLRGSGVAPEPRGLLNTVGINAVTNGTNGNSLAGYGNLFSASQAILQADSPLPTAAIMSPRSLVKLGGLTDSTGQPLRVPTMLESVKMIGTSQIPNNLTVGTSTDCSEIYMGDFSKMFFLMRENMTVQLLREHFATTGEIGFLCHVRADVAVTHPKAFALVTGVRA